MEKKRSLVKSVHNRDQTQCIDIFLQDSGYFAFREFRRDIEDFSHWFPVSNLVETTYSDISQLESFLYNQFNWLDTDP